KEPLWVLVKTLFWGGLLSLFFAGVIYVITLLINHNIFAAEKGSIFAKFGFAMFVGITEETAKALAAIILTRKLADFDEPVDGIIYGMTVALGFAAFENIQYMMASSYRVIFARHFLSVPLHITCGAIWGYGLALNKYKFKRPSNLKNLFPYIAAAAFLHGIYDFLCFIQVSFPFAIVILIALTFISYRWAIVKIRKLVAISPFLAPGECSECRTINEEDATICKKCKKELPDREAFYSEENKES
ncbi:PrsW family intramembrane metalloprotease, partial [bacterium]|nr:PrsW family intramembrane metalloprotease [bacterium]